MKSAAERRRATFVRGHLAEAAALAALLLKGYRPLARRYAAAGGEVDLIVARGDTIAFVEVKARGLMDDALVAITAAKRRRFAPRGRRLARAPPGGRREDLARRCGVRGAVALAAAPEERVRP